MVKYKWGHTHEMFLNWSNTHTYTHTHTHTAWLWYAGTRWNCFHTIWSWSHWNAGNSWWNACCTTYLVSEHTPSEAGFQRASHYQDCNILSDLLVVLKADRNGISDDEVGQFVIYRIRPPNEQYALISNDDFCHSNLSISILLKTCKGLSIVYQYWNLMVCTVHYSTSYELYDYVIWIQSHVWQTCGARLWCSSSSKCVDYQFRSQYKIIMLSEWQHYIIIKMIFFSP